MGVGEGGGEVQARSVAHCRLGLMRHEVHPIGPRQRGHVRQASKPTGFDDIGLHNVAPHCQTISYACPRSPMPQGYCACTRKWKISSALRLSYALRVSALGSVAGSLTMGKSLELTIFVGRVAIPHVEYLALCLSPRQSLDVYCR